eukprot:gene1452-4612_t
MEMTNNCFMSESKLSLQRGCDNQSNLPTPRAIPGYQGHLKGLRDYPPGRRFGSSCCHLTEGRKCQNSSTTDTSARFLEFSKPPSILSTLRKTNRRNMDFSKQNGEQIPNSPDVCSPESHREILHQPKTNYSYKPIRRCMVPGYCGHVPHLRDQLAIPFGSAAAEAISCFEKQRNRRQSSMQALHRRSPLLPQRPNLRDSASVEKLAEEAAKSTYTYIAQYSARTPYSRKMGTPAGATVHVPFQEHTSVGKSRCSATRQSAMMLRGSRPHSRHVSGDRVVEQIIRSRSACKPRVNTARFRHVDSKDYVI